MLKKDKKAIIRKIANIIILNLFFVSQFIFGVNTIYAADKSVRVNSMKHFKPGIASSDSTTVSSEPAVTNPEPAVTNPEPAVTNPEPAVTNPEPAVTNPEPAVTNPEPAVTNPDLIVTSSEGVSCKALGMIPDNKGEEEDNYKILLAEVKKGTKIYVDGTYYLYSSYSDDSTENKVDSGLSLIGDSPTKSKLILAGGTYFNIKGSALVDNITIECPSTTRLSYLFNMTAPFVNEITISNNYITGNIRLVNSVMPLNFDFASTPCGIEKLIIENNGFYDVYNSGGARYIMNLKNTPVKSCYITNNKVTNYSYIFYMNGITNDQDSATETYLLANSNAVIEDNEVICTDDYDAVGKNGGYNSCDYYCFALIEGFSVECIDNVFEGFHVSNAPMISVYDNYLSVTKLLYEGNTWKNIVNFTPNIQYVDIMKSKFGVSINGEKLERIYRKNTYIVEPSYADSFNQDRFLLRKEINTYQEYIDSIIIEDNYFDMYILSFGYGGQMYKELYKFSGNTVLMDTVEHSINTQTFAYIEDMKDRSGNYIQRDLIVTNNTITCDTAAFGDGIGTKKSYLIWNKAGSGDKTTVDLSNNKIDLPERRDFQTPTPYNSKITDIIYPDPNIKTEKTSTNFLKNVTLPKNRH
ncbi:MAG: hypothetical protein WC364_00590 [Eubacteriales bacterium]